MIQRRRNNIHGAGTFPLCSAFVVVDVVGAPEVVHLLLPARGQRGQQLLGPLGARVGRVGHLPPLVTDVTSSRWVRLMPLKFMEYIHFFHHIYNVFPTHTHTHTQRWLSFQTTSFPQIQANE